MEPRLGSRVLPHALAAERHGSFVGRGAELAQLERSWRSVAHGSGAPPVVLVAGEPGVGKTRLVAEAMAEASAAGCTVLFGRTDPGVELPFQPFVEAFRDHLAKLPEPDAAALLAAAPAELAWLLPGVSAAPAEQLDPASGRFRMMDAAASHLRTIARDAPVVLVIDDLQWADHGTLTLLRHLVRVIDQRFALLATIRTSERGAPHLDDALADLWSREATTSVDLSGLDVVDVQELASDRATGAEVHRLTAGNPFFVRHVLRHVASDGDLATMPASVADAVRLRLWALDERTVDLLAVASVIGRAFDLDILTRVVGCGDEEALAQLEAATTALLVHEDDSAVDRFAFDHALVRDALMGDLSSTRRARLHARIAAVLEARRAPSELVATELAHHLLEAADPRRAADAIGAARRAAAAAVGQFAFDDAALMLERALALLDALPAESGGETARLAVLLELSAALEGAGSRERARAHYGAAASLARAAGDGRALALAALGATADAMVVGRVDAAAVALLEEAIAAVPAGEHRLVVGLHAALARELLFAPDARLPVRAAEAGVAVARAQSDHGLLVDALGGLHQALLGPGAPTERLAIAEEIVELARLDDDLGRRRWAHAYRFVDRLQLLDLAGAAADADEVSALAGLMRPPTYSWWGEALQASVALCDGRLAEAEAGLTRAFELGLESDGQNVLATWATQLFVLRWLQGRLEEMVPVFASAPDDPTTQSPVWRLAGALAAAATARPDDAAALLAPLRGRLATLPLDPVRTAAVALAGLVAHRVGDRDLGAEAAALLEVELGRGIVIATGTACLGPADTFAGLARAAAGALDEALRHLQAGEELAARAGAATWELHARAERVSLLRRRGAPGDAELADTLAAEAAERAARSGMAGVTPQATVRTQTT